MKDIAFIEQRLVLHFPGGKDLFAVEAAASVGLQLGQARGREAGARSRPASEWIAWINFYPSSRQAI